MAEVILSTMRQMGRSRWTRAATLVCLLAGAYAVQLAEQRVTRAAEQYVAVADRIIEGRARAADLERRPALAPVALRSLIQAGHPERALRFSRAAQDSREGLATYQIAALLESGRYQSALETWADLDPRVAGPFSARVRDSIRALDRGMTAALFDRRGATIAYRNTSGEIELARDVDARWVPEQALRAMPSLGGARLSLDLELSEALTRQLIRRTRSKVRGGVVVLNRDDASLVAAATRQTDLPVGHDFLENRREPASTSKLLTTAAALRAGFDPDAYIDAIRCRGSVPYPNGPIYCPSIHGDLRGLEHAMAKSDNVSFARMGGELGSSRLIGEYERFGFASADANASPLYGQLIGERFTDREIGELAIGLNQVDVTPLHAAAIARLYADGLMKPPRQVVREDGILGMSPEVAARDLELRPIGRDDAPDAERILERDWLPILQRSMKAVADPGGTAYGVEPLDMEVAMKTGTGVDPETGFHTNYIGLIPARDPVFAFSIRLTHGRSSKEIRQQAASVTYGVLRELAAEVRERKEVPFTGPALAEPSLFTLLASPDDFSEHEAG